MSSLYMSVFGFSSFIIVDELGMETCGSDLQDTIMNKTELIRTPKNNPKTNFKFFIIINILFDIEMIKAFSFSVYINPLIID
jgi:hypothetical protein